MLVPANKWDEIARFLDSCPGLSNNQRDQFKKQVHNLKQVIEQESSEEIEELDAKDSFPTRHKETDLSETGSTPEEGTYMARCHQI